jgi:hypothetical protein
MLVSIRSRVVLAAIAAALVVTPDAARAQDLSVAKGTSQPAPEVVAPIRDLLANDGVTVKRGDNTLEFWFAKALALTAAPSGAPTFSDVPEGAVVGAVRIAQAMNDIRGLTVKPGVYTLRFAHQPQDGDHSGVSPFREFLLLCPAAADQTADALGYKGTVSLSKKASGRSHPITLSVDPPTTDQPAGKVITTEAGHQAVTLSLPTSAGTPITFGLILVGTIEHQM